MTKRVVAKKVNGSSTIIKPPKPKAMIEKPKKPKPALTMKTTTFSSTMETTPPSAIQFKDNDRVSMMKRRFASIILKAQQQLSQTERLGLKTTYIVEKLPTPTPTQELRSEATRKVLWRKKKPPTPTPIPTPTLTRSTEELRKAARKALEELEQSVEVEDSHKSVKELEKLCGWPIPYVGGFKNRMEYYGLYLKNY